MKEHTYEGTLSALLHAMGNHNLTCNYCGKQQVLVANGQHVSSLAHLRNILLTDSGFVEKYFPKKKKQL